MGFGASIYGLIFWHDFLKLFWKMEKLIIFMQISIFFQLMPGNKSYAQISLKQGHGGNKQNSNFQIDYFFLHRKLWFIPFVFVTRKLWTILFFRQLEHLLEKITYRIHFRMQFLQFKKKSTWFSVLIRIISPLKLVHFNSILKILIIKNFPSISYLLIFNP